MIDLKTAVKILALYKLIKNNEWLVRDLAWEIGVRENMLVEAIRDLSKNYLITMDNNHIVWNPADIPSKLKPWGWELVHEPILGSTQEAARGLGPWSIVVAEYMFMGRGRHGKEWKTGLGGLWVTFKISTNAETAALMPIIVPVILTRILRTSLDINARIKWPNDIVVNGKKLAGILIEAEAFRNKMIIYIGIGMNVNNEPPLETAVSIKQIKGMTPRNKLLSMMIGWISRAKKLAEEPEKLREQYLEYLDTLNKVVTAKTREGVIQGVAVDVNDLGYLVLETEDGRKILDPTITYEVRY